MKTIEIWKSSLKFLIILSISEQNFSMLHWPVSLIWFSKYGKFFKSFFFNCDVYNFNFVLKAFTELTNSIIFFPFPCNCTDSYYKTASQLTLGLIDAVILRQGVKRRVKRAVRTHTVHRSKVSKISEVSCTIDTHNFKFTFGRLRF